VIVEVDVGRGVLTWYKKERGKGRCRCQIVGYAGMKSEKKEEGANQSYCHLMTKFY
jgi:hypothetical protein